MTKNYFSAAMLLATIATPDIAIAGSCGAHESELRSIKLERWPGFYRDQDVTGLSNFLDDSFMVIDSSGTATPKADELLWLAANPWSPSDFVYQITSISCPTPEMAVIVGEGRSTRPDGARRISNRYISSNVLVRSETGWRAVLSHISGERREPIE